MKEPGPLQQVDRTYVRCEGRKLSYFAGCDYFRLASHPKVLARLRAGISSGGFNVAASRLTTGNHVFYGRLETALKDFFRAPDALLVSTGYVTNLVVAQALAGTFSHALLDDHSHVALADAAQFLSCPVVRFQSRDPGDLKKQLGRCGSEARVLLMTDGMFARDGATAPLAEYAQVLPRDAAMLVDDAHGAGVVGKNGRGTPEYAGVGWTRLIQTITLSKAFGCYGGAILGTPDLRERILERSSLFVGSTPLPLPIASAAEAAVRLLRSTPSLRTRLQQNASFVKEQLRSAGRDIADHPGPIIPVFPESSGQADSIRKRLLRAGIFPSFIRYPGAPREGYFRFVISSEHSEKQLERLVEALA